MRTFKKSGSRSTYHRIKKNAESLLSLVSNRTKNTTYNRKNEDELKQFEEHCRRIILDCYKRKYVIRLNVTSVAQIMQNEAEKFTFPWLKSMQFHKHYALRFIRVTFFPVVQYAQKLGFTPAFVLDCKCTRWSIKPLKIEEKNVVYRDEKRTLLRKCFKDFTVYYSSNAWINGAIYAWELQRLSGFLKRKTPNTRYLILVDNVPSHIPTEFQTLFIPPNCTAKLQPLDCSIFGTLKNQYYSWLMKKTISIGPENITLEMAVTSLASIFGRLDVRSINHGFKMTGLSLFQSEPTIETKLTPDERIMNLCERFDKFACSDSEDE